MLDRAPNFGLSSLYISRQFPYPVPASTGLLFSIKVIPLLLVSPDPELIQKKILGLESICPWSLVMALPTASRNCLLFVRKANRQIPDIHFGDMCWVLPIRQTPMLLIHSQLIFYPPCDSSPGACGSSFVLLK